MIPDWLQRHLETIGRADTDGVRRRARYQRCPTCDRPTLVGLDADTAGLPVRADVVDLDPLAELTWLIGGHESYDVREVAGLQLNRREPERIRAGRQDTVVVGQHHCGRPPPPSKADRWRVPTRLTTDDAPPF